jgi:hypothetical protein
MALLGRGFRNRRDYEKALEQLHKATDGQQRASEAVAALLVVQGRRLNLTRQQFPQQKACARGDAARLAAPAFPITSWRACRG